MNATAVRFSFSGLYRKFDNMATKWVGNRVTYIWKDCLRAYLKFTTVKPHLTATSVKRSARYYGHFFWPPGKSAIHFLVKKALVNTANFFGPSY